MSDEFYDFSGNQNGEEPVSDPTNTETYDTFREQESESAWTEPESTASWNTGDQESTASWNTGDQENTASWNTGEQESTDSYNTGDPGNTEPYDTGDPAPEEPPKKPKKDRKNLKKAGAILGSGVIFGLAAGLVFYGVVAATGITKKNTTQIPETTQEALIGQTATASSSASEVQEAASSDSAAGTYTVSQIAQECLPSVVSITCISVEEVQSFFGTQQYEGQSAGSGIIIGENDTELLIATNNHVVSDSETISVCFNDDQDEVVSAVIKGTDSENDLAVVAVALDDLSDEIKGSIKIATLGDSDALTVGEQVVAIGNALGYGQSVTSGVVSALNREVQVSDTETASSLIQTDAAINPGNSGGALFNMKGEVVGINSAKYASEEVEGMGYAIPITKAKDIINDLSSRKTRSKVDEDKKGALGITCLDVSSEVSEMYNLPTGVYVREVAEGGAAEAAGMQAGDIITKFDGQSVSDKDSLVEMLAYYEIGETVEVVVERAVNGAYEEQTLEVTLAKQVIEDSSTTSETEESQSQDGGTQDGGSQYMDPYSYYGQQGGGAYGYGSNGSGSSGQGDGALGGLFGNQ